MIYVIAFLVALAQATAANLITVANIKQDLLLIMVVFVALRKGPLNAAAVGAIAGFLKDVLSTGAFLNTLVFPVCGILAGLFAERFYKENVFMDPLIVFTASVFVSAVYLVWFSHWDYPPSVFVLAIRVGIPTALYTALVSLPVFFILKKISPDAA